MRHGIERRRGSPFRRNTVNCSFCWNKQSFGEHRWLIYSALVTSQNICISLQLTNHTDFTENEFKLIVLLDMFLHIICDTQNVILWHVKKIPDRSFSKNDSTFISFASLRSMQKLYLSMNQFWS